MSDYEKDDELRRKYGEVMDSIADDIRQINVNKSEKIVLDEKADDISENTEDILSGFESAGGSDAIENNDVKHDYSDNKFLESISRIDFDNQTKYCGVLILEMMNLKIYQTLTNRILMPRITVSLILIIMCQEFWSRMMNLIFLRIILIL